MKDIVTFESLLHFCNRAKSANRYRLANLAWAAAFLMLEKGDLMYFAQIESSYHGLDLGDRDKYYDLLRIGTSQVGSCAPIPMLRRSVEMQVYETCIVIEKPVHRRVIFEKDIEIPQELKSALLGAVRRLAEVFDDEAKRQILAENFPFSEEEEAARAAKELEPLVGKRHVIQLADDWGETAWFLVK